MFSEVVYLAGVLREQDIQHIHTPWAGRKAYLSMIVSRLIDLPYSVEGRAYDLHRWSSQYGISEILQNADFIITNTEYNRRHILKYFPTDQSEKIHLSYTRLDLNHFLPVETTKPRNSPVRLLAVGRLIEEKGLIHLLSACSILKDMGIPFECRIIGGAQIETDLRTYLSLQSAYKNLGLEDVLTFYGSQSLSEVINALHWGDIFVLPCVKAESGAHDIDPNVIVEAMAMELPVVSTPMGGIPEIIDDGINGILVEPSNDFALAKALLTLINDPEMRIRYGLAGREKISQRFEIHNNSVQLAGIFNMYGKE